MKINLGIKKPTMIKKFNFDINKEYKEEVIGKNETGSTSVIKLPNFIGLNEDTALKKAQNLGISTTIKYVTNGNGENLTVLKQSIVAGTDVSNVKSLILTVLKEDKVDSNVENNLESSNNGSNLETNQES